MARTVKVSREDFPRGGLDHIRTLLSDASVTGMDLSGCRIGKQGGQAIGKALETNSTLRTLNLINCNIGEQAGQAIGKALETNSTLRNLDLNGCDIGEQAGKAIAKALESNSTLRTLDLFECGVGHQAGQAFANALQTNSTLTFLGLGFMSYGWVFTTITIPLRRAWAVNRKLVRQRRAEPLQDINVAHPRLAWFLTEADLDAKLFENIVKHAYPFG